MTYTITEQNFMYRFGMCLLRALRPLILTLVAASCLLGLPEHSVSRAATAEVVDDTGAVVRLKTPARRIISIAPHATELLFAAGAGAWIVGVSAFSDYPEAAREIPRIGDAERLDFERIVALKPDLVVVWASGNRSSDIERLEEFGLSVFRSEPQSLESIATNIERLGLLVDRADIADAVAATFRQQVEAFGASRRQVRTLRTFFQIWHTPLMTLNGQHLISEVINLCGGENVFAELGPLVPQIDMEAVIARNPEVILSSGSTPDDLETLKSMWRPFKNLAAIRQNNVYLVPADLISRQSPRVLEGAQFLCNALDSARTI